MDVILCGTDLYSMSSSGEVHYWARKDNILASDGLVTRIEPPVVQTPLHQSRHSAMTSSRKLSPYGHHTRQRIHRQNALGTGSSLQNNCLVHNIIAKACSGPSPGLGSNPPTELLLLLLLLPLSLGHDRHTWTDRLHIPVLTWTYRGRHSEVISPLFVYFIYLLFSNTHLHTHTHTLSHGSLLLRWLWAFCQHNGGAQFGDWVLEPSSPCCCSGQSKFSLQYFFPTCSRSCSSVHAPLPAMKGIRAQTRSGIANNDRKLYPVPQKQRETKREEENKRNTD